MDTSTHIVMGIGLGGLATIDPAVATNPVMPGAVMVATLIGSQAPDFDTILKLRNNAVYIRNHRGLTHSIPAVIIWSFLISTIIALFVSDASWLTLLLWTFIAVFLHVFVDIFNAYGTQALRPFSNKWIALGIINIFDPFIFASHVVAIMLWWTALAPPGPVFFGLYSLLILYYCWRIKEKRNVVRNARSLHPDATHIFVSPSIRWNQWHLVIRTPQMLYVAESRHRNINFFERYQFVPIPETTIINAARKDPNLSAFLSFSPTYRWEVDESSEGMQEVRFYDLRYRSKGHYPFVAIVQMDENLEIVSSYTGWVFSEETLQKKLKVVT
ncbi:metal-dependent hydrolase [Alkalicoccobacillus porphyridii]|uniref:Metal-dependent hydrolase n=1 Tax=Alkalicoccobacillus porphyridii TaxID=2597270 RepID=A0A553ZV41_9BACI|nr:metal-dependent hydrolase [Alkalicoccobacillus porphyridii]TSB45195.1 metal-dependent hydrolase [Alkalicoccobacillus porphyridii]